MKRVAVEDVSRVYGRNFALHRVSVDFDAGSVTALIGGNGAGKTTLLNILATLDRPTSGSVSFGDATFDEFAKWGRRQIGWVSHESLLYADLSGRENLEFYGRLYGVDSPSQLAEEWLDRVGLADVGDRLVNAYSRGMRQRLSVARALLHDPPLLLLDEPLTGLDRPGRERMLEVFDDQRERGKVVVMITHDLNVTSELVDTVAVLKRGKLTHHGPVDSLLNAYAAHG